MRSVEEAYQAMGEYLISFVNARQWDKAVCKFSIFKKMSSADQYFIFNGTTETKGGFENNSAAIWKGLTAARFIRDNLIETTGKRIWGLTFTLFPDGKFEIEYDYNKPEDYEETDELISGEEINESLNNLKS